MSNTDQIPMDLSSPLFMGHMYAKFYKDAFNGYWYASNSQTKSVLQCVTFLAFIAYNNLPIYTNVAHHMSCVNELSSVAE